jgi:hypothetical protein
MRRSGREVRQRIGHGPCGCRYGGRPTGGRWVVRSIRAVRRHEGRRGRLLDVLVEWEGENSDADLLDRTWRINGSAGHVAYIVTIGSYLSADLRADARKSEAEGLYLGPRPVPAASRSRRSRRAERRTRRGERNPTAHSGEREREARGGLPARLRDPQHRIWDADTQIEQYGRSSVLLD